MNLPTIPPKLALVSFIIAIGWASPLFRLAAAPPLLCAGMRVLFATLILLFFFGRQTIAALASSYKNWISAIAAGVFLAAHFAAWVPSLMLTTVAASTLLVATEPLFAACFESFFLKEKIPRRVLVGVLIAFLGTTLLFATDLQFEGNGESIFSGKALLGDALAIVGAIFGAAYFVIGRGARKKLPIGAYLVIVNASAAILLLVSSYMISEPWFAPSNEYIHWNGIQPSSLGWFLLLAIVPQLLGHGAANIALRSYPATMVNLAVLSEPILASTLAWLLFSEMPKHPLAFAAGGTVLLFGLIVALTGKK
ncbi:MAG: DMT family transporter [Planctomycetota bacterium]